MTSGVVLVSLLLTLNIFHFEHVNASWVVSSDFCIQDISKSQTITVRLLPVRYTTVSSLQYRFLFFNFIIIINILFLVQPLPIHLLINFLFNPLKTREEVQIWVRAEEFSVLSRTHTFASLSWKLWDPKRFNKNESNSSDYCWSMILTMVIDLYLRVPN